MLNVNSQFTLLGMNHVTGFIRHTWAVYRQARKHDFLDLE